MEYGMGVCSPFKNALVILSFELLIRPQDIYNISSSYREIARQTQVSKQARQYRGDNHECQARRDYAESTRSC